MQSVQGLHRAFIALGSNLGDRVEMIEKACLEMDRAGIKVKRTSSLFETTPMYVLDQGTFMNGVCEVCVAAVMLGNMLTDSLRLKLVSRHWTFWIRSSPLRLHWVERS